LYALGERRPTLRGSGHFIAPGAAVIGSVTLEDRVSVWFNAVIRADGDTVHIGAGANIQDGAVLHVDPGWPMVIGADVTVGHQAMLHGCSVGDCALVGINAVVLNGARIGPGALIGANALVTENMEVPAGGVVLGSPGRVVRILPEEQRRAVGAAAHHYVSNAAWYNRALQVVANDA
jgi:carbonic anhydrase/acetyltransferase-like protein (isoleucine patch superfamily)